MSILQQLPQNRTLVMGILNVTPDSFSDGGLHYAPEQAVEHALDMVKQGADLIDVGGESTRPGAVRISPEEEQRRILPVIRELAARGVVMSVDTMNASTARAAVEAGAHIINDVSGMSVSAEMIETVAQLGVPYILMHARGDSTTMDSRASYENTVAEVVQELAGLKQRLLEAGVKERNIIVDPGLGFAKAGLQDWQLIAGIEELKKLGPVLVAGSRKRFVATLLKNEDERRTGAEVQLRDSEGRDVATATISAFSALHGAWGVRVHAVRESADAIATVSAIRAAEDEADFARP
ncbi:dihydropteroate synthase [Rothia aerolata]|uniref:Dihydropteroate synthase n=1 Tax=Rothia aerolata TaxID=1812262 RepID=A0A917IV91_9MICC|nr:dihydropteroate synthase [Rothia aerolata]GGH64210.1 dihydropteroate synthase [Rothia aerolata]